MKKTKGLFYFILVLAAVVLVAAACIALLGPGGTQEEVSHTPRVDVIEIAGTIATEGGGYDHQWTLQFLDQITADPNSLGLVVSIDSSGGSVYAAQELYEKLSTYRQTGRPVYISLQEYGASAAYYIAMAGQFVSASPSTITGSIGVRMGTYLDYSGYLELNGIRAVDITSGEYKNTGSPYHAMTEEERAILQALVDESYEDFVKVVAQGRSLPESRVRELADGRIYSGSQALSLGLVDRLAGLDETIQRLMTDYQLEERCQVVYHAPPQPTFWEQVSALLPEFLTGSEETQSPAGQAQPALGLISDLGQGALS